MSQSVDRSSAAAAHAFIERNRGVRQVNKILHSFPSPRLWDEREVPARELLERRRDAGISRDLALYVGVPYCIKTKPSRCGYCLFPVEEFTGNKDLEHYFGYLEREGELYRELFANDRLYNVYFGGGTSNLYRPEKYLQLMELVRSVFGEPGDHVTVTLEGIPQLFTREKLQNIKASGMNRVSMGVQQMDDELNKLSGRRQTNQHTLDAIAWCQEFGLPCNVDLIFGWPRQTVKGMVEGLERLVATGVHHITHYELNVGGPTDFALNRRHELPSVAENLEMYHAARELLLDAGYVQLTAYDWERAAKPEEVLYEECDRGFRSMDILGWGYAGVSQFEGVGGERAAWATRNHVDLRRYFEAVDAGQIPVDIGFYHGAADHRLAQLFRNLQSMVIDLDQYQHAFGIELLDEYAGTWEALGEVGFIEIEDRRLRVVGDGVFYTPMIQTLLARQRIAELSRARAAKSHGLAVLG